MQRRTAEFLAEGYHATFSWTDSNGTLRQETWLIGLKRDTETTPHTESKYWLTPFMGMGIHSRANVQDKEGNECEMTLIGILVPPGHDDYVSAAA